VPVRVIQYRGLGLTPDGGDPPAADTSPYPDPPVLPLRRKRGRYRPPFPGQTIDDGGASVPAPGLGSFGSWTASRRRAAADKRAAAYFALIAGQSSVIVPPDPPDVGPPRVTEPFVPRDPEAPRRTREHLDVVAMMLNSFLRQGLIARTGKEDFVIHTGRYAEPRPPTPDDGTAVGATAGATWFDSVGETFWLCKDPTQGSAVWVQIGLV
jgi:hypothetical protein